jgi:hypothetical protein
MHWFQQAFTPRTTDETLVGLGVDLEAILFKSRSWLAVHEWSHEYTNGATLP